MASAVLTGKQAKEEVFRIDTERQLDPNKRYEIIDGEYVEMPNMATDSEMYMGILFLLLGSYTESKGLGHTFVETLIQLDPDIDTSLRPDIVFVSAAKYPLHLQPPETKTWQIVPDICIEVISPNDHFTEVSAKMGKYFRAGVEQVWQVEPREKRITVYTGIRKPAVFEREDTLTSPDILPGFELPLRKLFRF
jgi:Uma2 family endonuclease